MASRRAKLEPGVVERQQNRVRTFRLPHPFELWKIFTAASSREAFHGKPANLRIAARQQTFENLDGGWMADAGEPFERRARVWSALVVAQLIGQRLGRILVAKLAKRRHRGATHLRIAVVHRFDERIADLRTQLSVSGAPIVHRLTPRP